MPRVKGPFGTLRPLTVDSRFLKFASTMLRASCNSDKKIVSSLFKLF
jgi:hypothetical protein